MLTQQYLYTATLLSVFASVTAINQDTIDVCSQLAAQLPTKIGGSPAANSSQHVYTNSSPAYVEAQSRYWDTANRDDVPACILFPSTAEDVSTAMRLLNKAPNVQFALKSGGHNWNRGFSSTDGGVLITFRPNMNYTKLSADNASAEIGPGARWGEVMAVLDAHDRCVVGGRVGDVGVGGYIPSGGISYLTAQYGFASDNVINFEVVTANGTILNANRTSSPDIFFAIRGGGNLFGVVTKYTLVTHPIGNVWGGIRAYTAENFPHVFSAIANYVAGFNETKSAMTPTMTWLGGSNSSAPLFNIFLFWDGNEPPAHVFAEFNAIPAASDTTKTQRYPELLEVDVPANFTLRTSDAVASYPSMPHDQMTDFLQQHQGLVSNTSFFTAPGFETFSMAIQPIPVALQKANLDRGPAALATNPAHGDKIWIEYSLGWSEPTSDGTWPQQLINLVHAGQDLQQVRYAGVKPTNYQSGDLGWDPYNPLFANDAQVGQPVLQSYGPDTYDKLKKLHAELDPNDVFLLQTKGFHF